MGQGINKTQRVDIIDSFDPRIVGMASQKGTLFRYIPATGDPELLIKNDDGFSTDWTSVSGEALPITVVAAASVADVTIATAPANLDGLALVAGDLVLIKDQTLPEENGVYEFSATGDPLVRAEAWNTANEFIPGRQVFINGGTTQADTLWANTNYVVTLGTTPIVFINISAAAGMATDFSNAVAAANDIDMGTNTVINAANPVNPQDVATKDYVDTSAMATDFSNAATAANDIDMGANTVINAANPVNPQDVATKDYVDTSIVPPTGTADTIAYFDNLGALASDAQLSYNEDNIGLIYPTAGGAVTFLRAGLGAMAIVHAANAAGTSLVSIAGNGSFIHGVVTADNSDLQAAGAGSFAHGVVVGSGGINANGIASEAFGRVGSTGTIVAGNVGTRASGYVDSAGLITATGLASFAHGYIDGGAGGTLSAGGAGAMVFGAVLNGGTIQTTGQGSFARGYVTATGTISSTGFGSHAQGYINQAGATIQATANGATAFGYITTAGGILSCSGLGSFMSGAALLGGTGMSVTADFAQAFGIGHLNDSYNSFVIGQYASTGFTPAALVTTDPAFLIGNGTSTAARSTAYRVDKDGRMTTVASQVNRIRLITGTDTLNARTDYKAIMTAAAGAYNLTLPAGEDGLSFVLSLSAANAGVFTVLATGGDVLDANIQAILNTNQPVPVTYLSGTWYAI